MGIKEELERRMVAAGEDPHSLAAKTKVTQATIWRILAGESVEPRESTVSRLAKFFNISNEVLWGRAAGLPATHQASGLSPDETTLIENYRRLDDRSRRKLLIEIKASADIAEIDREPDSPPLPKERRAGYQ